MNYLAHGEMYSIIYTDNSLMHYGIPKKSGRYKYGTGERPYQHTGRSISKLTSKVKKRFSAEGRAKAATKKYKQETKAEKAKQAAIIAKQEARHQKEERKALQKSDKEVKKNYRNKSKYSSSLSDEELNRQIDRLAKEKRLKDLTDEVTANKVSKGQKYVNSILKNAGKTVLTTAAVGVGTYALSRSLNGAAEKSSNPEVAKTIKEIAAAATKKKDK